MRDEPGDAFAPRPEGAGSATYQVIKLGEESLISRRDSADQRALLNAIARYREQYAEPKSAEDFGTDYVSQFARERYLSRWRAFESSELAAATAYLESLGEELVFAALDPEGDDSGGVDWCDASRGLRIEDFHRTHFSSDWNQYLLLIRHIPTALDGFARMEFQVGGETIAFRKPARKKLWQVGARYFWVHAALQASQHGPGAAPLLLQIEDPNDRAEMNGSYLVIPRRHQE